MREVKSRVSREDPEFLPVTFTGTNPGSRERTRHTLVGLVSPTHRDPAGMGGKAPLPGKAVGGAGVGTAMGTPTLPLPLFSRLLLRLLLGWLPPLLPLLTASRSANM